MKSGDTGQRQTGAPSKGGEGCEGLHSAVPTAPLSERGLSPGKRIAQPPRTTSNTMRKTGRELSGLALRAAIDFPPNNCKRAAQMRFSTFVKLRHMF